MPIEDIKRLFEDLERNAELAAELQAAEGLDAFVAAAVKNGYQVSAEELRTSLRPEPEEELGEEELQRVAGGIVVIGGMGRKMPALRPIFEGSWRSVFYKV